MLVKSSGATEIGSDMRTSDTRSLRRGSFATLCHVLLLLWPAAEAAAAPNASCPGTCVGDGLACGGDDDCPEGGACVFDAACWPGLGALIDEVVPEYPGGIADPAQGWMCHDLACSAVSGELVLNSTGTRTGVARKDFALASGRTYGIGARISVAVGVTVDIIVAGGAGALATSTLTGPLVAEPVMVEFPLLHGAAGGLEVELAVHGAGQVRVASPFVAALREHEVWVRLSVPAAAGPMVFRDTDIWRHDEQGVARHHRACTADYAGDQPCLSTSRFVTTTEANGRTRWLDWGAFIAGRGIALHRIEPLEPAGRPLRVGIEVAWAPDEAAIVWRGETSGSAHAFVIAIPEEGGPASLLRDAVGLPVDAVARDLARVGGFADESPLLAGGQLTIDSDAAHDAGVDFGATAFDLAASLGHGTFAFTPDASTLEADQGLESATRVVALHDWWRAGGVDTDADVYPDWDIVAFEAAFETWLDAQETLALALETRGDATIVVDLGPVRFAPWRGAAWQDAFQQWMQSSGLSPGALGVEDWEELQPPEGVVAQHPERVRPMRQEVEASRRWYAGLRFLSERTAEVYRVVGRALRARGVTRVEVRVGSPRAGGSLGFGVGPDVYVLAELGRLDGITFSRDGDELDQCRVWELGAWAAWSRAWASPAIERAAVAEGGFALGHAGPPAVGTDPVSAGLQLAMHGFSRIVHEGYGPAPFDAAAFGGRGHGSVGALDAVLRQNRVMATALGELGGAAVNRSPIVMFAGQTDPRWVDLPALTDEEIGWYTMLSHSGWPVEVVAEDEIGLGLLERPDQGRSMLILLRRHVSRAAWAVIQAWVEAGGHLVVGADLPIFDEFGQLVLARAAWFGVDVGSSPVGSGNLNAYRWQTADGFVAFQSTVPWREVFALSGIAVAHVEEPERPVAVRFQRSRGRVTVSGIALGEAYLAPVRACLESGSGVVAGWSDAMRRVGDAVARAAGLRIDRVVKGAGVQLRVFGTHQKPWLALMTHDPRPMNLVFESRELQRCESLRDVLGGGDAWVNLGSVLAPVQGAALYTWDPDDCTVPLVVPRPERPVEPEPEPIIESGGCDSAHGGEAWWSALALVWVAWRLRRTRRAETSSRG
jgi:uncharacterized protein (TIGR03382 family)